jgi:selenocysteine lyase/cysteine desulfurase
MQFPPLDVLARDRAVRHALFPVTRIRTFLSHAAVSPLPACAAEALSWFGEKGSLDQQECPEVWRRVLGTRGVAARLLGCGEDEVALLGPTALGLNLVADGLEWRAGDEVVYHADDYPANVYPWTKLAARGVRPVALRPERPGEITPDLVEAALTPRTRLVALASAHFLGGYRIEVDEIGRRLRARGVLFCLDGIQTLGAFPTPLQHVDFMSADSHKWLLGPLGAGVFVVKREHFAKLRPAHLGSWNVVSPNFVAQDDLDAFYEGARRYECGSLNVPGIVAMRASMEMLLQWGVPAVAARIRELRAAAIRCLEREGWEPFWPDGLPEANTCGIATFKLGGRDAQRLARRLEEARVSVSIRHDRAGRAYLRVSPHVSNTEEDMEALAAAVRE